MFYYCHNRWNFKYILDVIKGVISKTSLYHIKGGFFCKTLKHYQFFSHTHKRVNLKIHACSSFNTRKFFFFFQFMKWPFLCQTLSIQSFTMQRQTGGVEDIDMKCSSCIQQKICVPLFHPPLFVCLIFFTVYREIFTPVLFSRLSPLLSTGEFKTGQIPQMSQIIPL